MNDPELLAILSLFESQIRGARNQPECSKSYSETFAKAKQFVFTETEKLIEMERELAIAGENDALDTRLNLKFYEMVYDYAQ